MSLAHFEATDIYDVQRALLNEAMKKHGDAFREELRLLSPLPFLDPTRAAKPDGKDAASFLAEKLALPLPEKATMAVDGVVIGKFPERALDIDVSAVDLSWMRELAAFDHWELTEQKPVGFHTTLPRVLDTHKLTQIARIRLLQGIASGDVKSAGEEVEDLARLTFSTEQWTVAMSGIHLMQLTRRAFEYARADGLDVEGWSPPDRKVLEAATRVLRAYVGALDYHVDPALLGDLLTSPDLTAGRCAALNEAAVIDIEIESVTGDRYREAHTWLTKALESTKGQCRLTLVREAWDREDQRALIVGSDAMCDADGDPGTCIAASIASGLPGIRDMQIEAFTMAAAGAFDGYNKRRERNALDVNP